MLYGEIAKQLTDYAVSFTHDVYSAEDIVSETFLRAAEHCIVKNNVPARAWFYKAARNIAIDRHRRDRRLEYCDIPDVADCSRLADPQEAHEYSGKVRQLMIALSKLPETSRSVLVLREFTVTDRLYPI